MKTRRLGKSQLQLSEIGLGCWQLGGDFGPIEDDTAHKILREAHAAGINFFDTADVYGAGRSEALIGEFLADLDTPPIVATKVGRDGALYPDDYSYDAVKGSLEASRDRLGVDTIDLAQLHCIPTHELESGEIFEVMNRLRSEGLFSHWGASVETIAEAHMCLSEPGMTSLQIIFNVFRQDAAWDLFDAAADADVGLIIRLSLASGLLTGKYDHNSQFDESDHRNFNRDGAAFSVGETFSGIAFSEGLELVEQLREHVPDNMSLADMSLRWILDHPAVTSVITGCSKPGQIERNVRAADLPPLPGELHQQLKDFYLNQVRSHIRCEI